MQLGRAFGVFLCLAAVVLTVVFLWGIVAQAYWAIAVPIALMVVFAMSMLFWVGWTFLVTDMTPPEERRVRGPRRRP